MAEIHADLDALKGFRDALSRYRLAQRDVVARGNREIEKTRASLEDKARRWQANLRQRQAALDACLSAAARASGGPGHGLPPGFPSSARGGGGFAVDCSAQARAVREAEERLRHVRRWQRKVETEAAAFRDAVSQFRDLVETDVPRAESHLLSIVSGLQAARGIRVPEP